MEQWFLHCKKADFAAISRKFNISPMLARILRNRDIEEDADIDRYLNGSIKDMYDPFLLKGMREAAELLSRNIENNNRIRIIGDYDVDGICSSYILETFIRRAGGRADVRLPNRIHDGYGMNVSMAEEAYRDGVSLIVTCDNGISAFEAVEKARELGIDVIVTDHHEPAEKLPDANVIIDAKQEGCTYPYKEICGASVAYKFMQALNEYMKLGEDVLLDDLIQFAGIATIADIVPLLDENRIIASEGLRRLKYTENPGLSALFDIRGIDRDKINAASVGFVLGPCINSAGRLDDPEIALKLFEEKDPAAAYEIAERLSELNEKRKDLTFEQSSVAMEELRICRTNNTLSKVLVLYLPDAHESVAGIIAGKIKEEYNRPTIVVTRSENGLKGSGRSTDCYNMIEGLREYPELFEKCGGHAKACGFSLRITENEKYTVEHFSRCLNESCGLKEDQLAKQVWIDMVLPFKYVNETFTRELERLEPFGMNNEKPVFAQSNTEVLSAAVMGRNNNALKMQLRDSDGTVIEGIYFGEENDIREKTEKLASGKRITILYYPVINEFRGRKTPQVNIKSMRICE